MLVDLNYCPIKRENLIQRVRTELKKCFSLQYFYTHLDKPLRDRFQKGVYVNGGFSFEHTVSGFIKESLKRPNYRDFYSLFNMDYYGVSDNIEQILNKYQALIESKDEYVLSVTPVYQDKDNAYKGGGWRWHKWGEYIGELNPEYEYLDDEDFGPDFKYVLVYSFYKVLRDE